MVETASSLGMETVANMEWTEEVRKVVDKSDRDMINGCIKALVGGGCSGLLYNISGSNIKKSLWLSFLNIARYIVIQDSSVGRALD